MVRSGKICLARGQISRGKSARGSSGGFLRQQACSFCSLDFQEGALCPGQTMSFTLTFLCRAQNSGLSFSENKKSYNPF
jgi:hypothetical protein